RGGTPTSKPLLPPPGQKYPVIKSAPSFFVRLDQALESLTNNINSLTKNIKPLLSQDNLNAIKHTLHQLDVATGTFAKDSPQIDASLKSMQVFFNNAANLSKQFPTISHNFTRTSSTVDKTMQAIYGQIVPEAYSTITNINTVAGN